MKRHRIFIAINLPSDIRKRLEKHQSNWPELPVRWTKRDNLHITLVFLGYLKEEELLEIFEITKNVALKHKSFEINLNEICYGPPKKMPPRMVWVRGEKSKELSDLRYELEEALIGGVGFSPEKRLFAPHITLGRIRQWEFKNIEVEDRPEVKKEINLTFPVNSIEIMESYLKRGGAEYAVLDSYPLESDDQL